MHNPPAEFRFCFHRTTGIVSEHAILSPKILCRAKFAASQSGILDVLCVLWETMSRSKLSGEGSGDHPTHLPLRFTSQMLLLTTAFLHNVRCVNFS